MSKLLNNTKPIHNSSLLISVPIAAGEEGGGRGWYWSANWERKAMSLQD